MEIKEEFYEIMTAHTAAIYHEELKLDFIIEDGRIIRVEKRPPVVGAT